MRLGLMIPSVNTVAEGEFHSMVPGDATVHTARLYPQGITKEILLEMIEHGVPRAARELAEVRPDVLVFGCTAAGAVLGAEGEAQLMDELSATVGGAPVVSMNSAVLRGLEATGASTCAVLAPYLQAVTDDLAAGVEASGIQVTVAAGMGITDPFEWASLGTSEITAFAKRHLEGQRFEAILLSCANVRAGLVRGALAEEWGVPIVSSNHAALEQALAVAAR